MNIRVLQTIGFLKFRPGPVLCSFAIDWMSTDEVWLFAGFFELELGLLPLMDISEDPQHEDQISCTFGSLHMVPR